MSATVITKEDVRKLLADTTVAKAKAVSAHNHATKLAFAVGFRSEQVAKIQNDALEVSTP